METESQVIGEFTKQFKEFRSAQMEVNRDIHANIKEMKSDLRTLKEEVLKVYEIMKNRLGIVCEDIKEEIDLPKTIENSSVEPLHISIHLVNSPVKRVVDRLQQQSNGNGKSDACQVFDQMSSTFQPQESGQSSWVIPRAPQILLQPPDPPDFSRFGHVSTMNEQSLQMNSKKSRDDSLSSMAEEKSRKFMIICDNTYLKLRSLAHIDGFDKYAVRKLLTSMFSTEAKQHEICLLVIEFASHKFDMNEEVKQTILTHLEVQSFVSTWTNANSVLLVRSREVKADMKTSEREGIILIGILGRFSDTMERMELLDFQNFEILNLDEADRLLDMGFQKQVNYIISCSPKQLLSATQTEVVEEIAKDGLKNPVRVQVRAESKSELYLQITNSKTPSGLHLEYLECKADKESSQLVVPLIKNSYQKLIIFFITCAFVEYWGLVLSKIHILKSIALIPIHGDMKQNVGDKALDSFTKASCGVLQCTDVAARVLDILGIDYVVQYDPVQDPNMFNHRAGITAIMYLVWERGRLLATHVYLKWFKHFSSAGMTWFNKHKWRSKVVFICTGHVSAVKKALVMVSNCLYKWRDSSMRTMEMNHGEKEFMSIIQKDESDLHRFLENPEVCYVLLLQDGAQKNVGPSGVTIMIILKDLIGNVQDITSVMLYYKILDENSSWYNTPLCFVIYMGGLVFEDLLDQDGLKEVEKNNQWKAELLTNAIEESHDFYRCSVEKSVRSLMNVPFTLEKFELEAEFIKDVAKENMVHLKEIDQSENFQNIMDNQLHIVCHWEQLSVLKWSLWFLGYGRTSSELVLDGNGGKV